MQGLDFPGAVEDIAGAAAFLKAAGSAKVGVTGFCMGGALTLATAVRAPANIAAAAPFYGVPPAGLADCAQVGVPVQAHFGKDDAMAGFSDPAAADALEASLAKSGQPFAVFRYDGVGHAFMNATDEGKARRAKLGQGGHNEAAVALAWERLLGFFAQHLRA